MLATIIYLFIFFKAGLTKVDIPRSKKKKKEKKKKKKVRTMLHSDNY